MIRKLGNRKISLPNWSKNRSLSSNFYEMYGADACECSAKKGQFKFIFSQSRPFDLIELEQLLQSVGWSRRPNRRVKKALDNSLLKIGLWQHDARFPRLVGFARCTGDGAIQATIWDVAINPIYQGYGLGKLLMSYLMKNLKRQGITRVTLFADSDVIDFYKRQGWNLEPKGNKCAFWYSN